MRSSGDTAKTDARPDDIPANPNITYKDDGWNDMIDWLGNEDRVHGNKGKKFSDVTRSRMSQAQKVQHIKILKGYGVSITLNDNHILLNDGKNPFSGEEDKESWFVSKIPYDKIIISGKGYVSTEAVKLLSEKNINVILPDTYGNIISNMNNVMSSNTATTYRMGQYDTFRDSEKVTHLQKQMLTSKPQSQIGFLKSLKREELTRGIEQLREYKESISGHIEKRKLLTIEAGCGHIYFGNYAKIINPVYGFESRHGSDLMMSNRHASDVINALLNYGYAVLAGEIAKFVNALGLDAYFGFYHKMRISFQSLIYDLIEPYRWLVEYAVFKTQEQGIKKKEYVWTIEGKVVLDTNLIRRFLELLSSKFDSERLYKPKKGLKRADGLAMCQEITIAKIDIQNLAECYTGERISIMKKGSKMSEEQKRKISKAKKGLKPWNKGKIGVYSKVTRRKMSEAKNGKKNPFYGKPHSEKTKRKMSKAQKARKKSL